MSTEDEKKWVHPWEPWHGKAPFHVVDFYQSIFRPSPDVPAKGGSSCDVCGNGIMNVYVVQSSDGHRFKVGIDCVEHAGDDALTAEAKSLKRVYRTPEQIEKARKAQEAKERAERAERDARALEYARDFSEVIRDATAAAGVVYIPDELREVAEKTLQGLVTGVWRKGPDKKWIEKVAVAAEIARLPAWTNKNDWLDVREGDKIKGLKVLVVSKIRFEGRYGWSLITKFRVIEGPEAGKLLIWYNGIGSLYEVMAINATVDGFTEYQGEKQTKLSRVTEAFTEDEYPALSVGQRVLYRQKYGSWDAHPAIVEKITPAGKVRVRYRQNWGNELIDHPLAERSEISTEMEGHDPSEWENLDEPPEEPYVSPFSVGERVLLEMRFPNYPTEKLPAVVMAITKKGMHRVKSRDGLKLVGPERLTKLTPELAEDIADWRWREIEG